MTPFLDYFVSMKGGIGRAHYWVLMACACVLVFLAATLGSLNVDNQPIQWLAYVVLLSSCIPMASASIRRLRDLDLGVWHIVLFFAVTGLLQLLAFLLARYSIALAIISGLLSVAAVLILGILKGASNR
jgi:uncharacterized membrane protein YhaH (DUF805 family)